MARKSTAKHEIVMEFTPKGMERVKSVMSGAAKSAEKMMSKVKRFSAGFADIRGGLILVGQVFDKTIGAMFRGFANATRASMQFEKSMLEVSTLVDTTQVSMRQQADTVKALSREFGGDINTQAKALYQAISSGAAAGAESTQLLTAANKLAVGGVTDVFTSVDALTTVLNAYGQNLGDQALPVTDLFFQTIKLGKTNATQLAGAIGQVAATASTSGVAMEEMFGVIAQGSKVIGNTNMTVVGLMNAINTIKQPSDDATKEAQRLGIAFNSQALKAKGLVGILREVANSSERTDETFNILFGNVRAGRLVSALLADNLEGVTSAIKDMDNAAGSADEATAKMTSSLGHQAKRFEALKSQVELTFGEMVTGSDAAKDTLTSTNNVLEAFLAATNDSTSALRVYSGEVITLGKVMLGNLIPGVGFAVQQFMVFQDMLKGSAKEAEESAKATADQAKQIANLAQLAAGFRLDGLRGEYLKVVAQVKSAGLDLGAFNNAVIAQEIKITENQRKEVAKRIQIQEVERKAREKTEEAKRKAAEKAAKKREKAAAKLRRETEKAQATEKRAVKEGMSQAITAYDFRIQKEAEALNRRNEIEDKVFNKAAERNRVLAGVLESTIGTAIDTLIFDTENFGKVMGQTILRIATQIAAKAAVFGLLSLFTGGTAGLGGFTKFVLGFSKGGFVPPVQKFSTGGFVTGGAPGRDSVPALLQPGEFVIPKTTVDQIRGGVAPSSAAPISQGVTVNVNAGGLFGAPTPAQQARWYRDNVTPTTRRLARNGMIRG